MNDFLTTDFRAQPYWWDAAPLTTASASSLGSSYDAVIVGSGLTGLRAALTLLRAGRTVVVIESAEPGFGASRRNAGFLGRVLKKSYLELKAAEGPEKAAATYRELDEAYQSTLQFIADEGIECSADRCGRFVGATSTTHYDLFAKQLELMKRDLGFEFHMISRSDQHKEMQTDAYVGGAVIPDSGSLHPGLYHKGLLERVVAAGGLVIDHCEVTRIQRDTSGQLVVTTNRGVTKAHDVVIATNGYTPRHFKWHARRVIPFTGYMAATEELPPDTLRQLLPMRRTVIDTNLNIDFFRPAPDSARLLFGGDTGSGVADITEIGKRLRSRLIRVLPSLSKVRFSHIWTGSCAGTFDMMPHVGGHDGIWFGLGYNFAGVPMGTHFGHKIGQQILGLPEGRSVFQTNRFPTFPLYDGRPWFVPYLMRAFDWQDRRMAARPTSKSAARERSAVRDGHV
ncbi:MAG TPA: FAD-binding oxidoreductase [Steroidobacteraceae bacterium]|nr:FAD-binding oxidoreductase [Steroidobacteraceae bacterium]